MNRQVNYRYGHKTLLDLVNLQDNGHLDVEPGFQRKSVWRDRDREKFIASVLDGFPVPSIFLYRQEEDGRLVYYVLDGKQRLETVFRFTGARGSGKQSFPVRYQLDGDERPEWYSWRDLRRLGHGNRVLSYEIQTAEVTGQLADIVDLFVRINSTGKALTSSEKRHARYYRSGFLRHAQKLAGRFRRYLLKQRIVSPAGIDRMKDVELVSELMESIANGGPIDQKKAVDQTIASNSLDGRTVARVAREVGLVVNVMRRMFPDLGETRFHNGSEFYTLFMVIWELWSQRRVLTDRHRNRQAQAVLRTFSDEVDRVRDNQRRAKGAPIGHRTGVEYLMTTQRGTDQLVQRTQRARIVQGLLSGLFERKDVNRLFSPEQRRLLWNSDEARKCDGCAKRLDWTNFHADHVLAHSRGGRTALKNAARLCATCNRRKGAGTRKPPRRRKRAARR